MNSRPRRRTAPPSRRPSAPRPKRAKTRARAAIHKDCRALQTVDGTAARRRVRDRYEQARHDLEQCRAQLRQFEENDQPAFSRWLHASFGALLTEIRSLEQRVAEAEELILEIQEEVWRAEVEPDVAYRRVLRRRARRTKAAPESTADSSSAQDDSARAGSRANRAPPEDSTADASRKTDAGRRDRNRPQGAKARETPRTQSKLKELYRLLTKRLHPDARKASPQEARLQEWWHMMQEAYQRGDVEQLEVILALHDVETAGWASTTSAGMLQRMTEQLRQAAHRIRQQLNLYRDDPAWNFSRSKTRWVMEGRIRHELTSRMRLLRRQAEEFRACLAFWRGGR